MLYFPFKLPQECKVINEVEFVADLHQENKTENIVCFTSMCHVTCCKFNTQFEFSGWREEGRWTGTKQEPPKERHSECARDHFILSVVWMRRPTNCVGTCAIAGLNVTRRGQQL